MAASEFCSVVVVLPCLGSQQLGHRPDLADLIQHKICGIEILREEKQKPPTDFYNKSFSTWGFRKSVKIAC